MTDDDTLLESIRGLAEKLRSLNRRAVRDYTPVVERILRTRSRDASRIEHTLDGLLGFCAYEPALVLYKKLCRHYWELDRAATASYVNAYREMWDSEAKEDDECAPDAPEAVHRACFRAAALAQFRLTLSAGAALT